MFVTALSGAILRDAVANLATVKLYATMGASERTASIAKPSLTGSGLKLTPAFLASANGSAIGNTPTTHQFGILQPVFVICNRVASWTKRNQIVNLIRLSVVIEKVKWYFVMNGKARTNNPARLASVIVSIARCFTLPIPVLTPVLSIATSPSGIISTRPILGTAPSCPALPIAKVMLPDRVGLFLNWASACIADHNNTIATNAYPMGFLPFSITCKTAKVIFAHFRMVRLPFYRFSALRANFCNHALIIPQVENII